MKKILVTSALPYANGPIHIGHLVEYIQTDIWVRYWRLRGRDAIYLCADDTHGTPIMVRARGEGITPEELIQRTWHEHVRDFTGFQIQFDSYYSTHSEENRQLSAEIYQNLKKNGHICEEQIEQAFCRQDSMFLPDRYIRGRCPSCGAEDQYGDSCEVCSSTYSPRDLLDPVCAQCGATPVWRSSRHLFFRLGDFAERLRQWTRAGHLQDEVANKIQEWFEIGLQHWDISRDAPYFGFEIPGEPGKYFYVWLDAPIGYMAATIDWCRRHGADFDAYWRREDEADVYHFIGKDIIYFHALFWPAMLMGAGFRTPTKLFVHGFLTVDGEKMSKSRGTFITAETYLRHLDPQYLRYYFASKLNSRVEDIDLNFEDFTLRTNADLVNKLANIPSRLLAILHKRMGGRLGRLDAGGRELVDRIRSQSDRVAALYEQRQFGEVTRLLGDQCAEVNRYLQEHAPWTLGDEERERVAAVCTAGLGAFKHIATYAAPILPAFAEGVARMLNVPPLGWASLDEVPEDRPVRPYERLVERVDPKKIQAMIEESKATLRQAEPTAEAPRLTCDPLVDCALVPMRVLAAQPVQESDKLLALRLQEPGGEERTVVAGLGHAAAAGLAGQELLVLANLEPRTFKGQQSRGMVLAAEVDGVPVAAVLKE